MPLTRSKNIKGRMQDFEIQEFAGLGKYHVEISVENIAEIKRLYSLGVLLRVRMTSAESRGGNLVPVNEIKGL